MERFAGVLAHDIRNPLTIAKGRVELARDDDSDNHLTIAADALERIAAIVDDVLTMAKQGSKVTATESITLSAMVQDCWQSVPTGEATVEVAGELVFQGAPNRVKHLFENLFRNAIEHGGPGVSVRVGRLDSGTGFYVEDTGPGIPEADREKVCESGYTTGTESLGLGLLIVDGVVAAHGWTITITNGKEGGARFEIEDVIVRPEPGT